MWRGKGTGGLGQVFPPSGGGMGQFWWMLFRPRPRPDRLHRRQDEATKFAVKKGGRRAVFQIPAKICRPISSATVRRSGLTGPDRDPSPGQLQ
jgi:hypothetical protein